MTPQRSGSSKDSSPKNGAEDESPRRRTHISEEVGPSTSCQNQSRTMTSLKRKMTEEQETEPPAKKIKTEKQLEQVPTTPPLSLVISKESRSPSPLLSSTKQDSREGNLKREAEDLIEQPSKKKVKFAETENGADSEKAEFQKKYVEFRKLGEGNFGSVFAGYRREDDLPVAIKHIRNGRNVLLEVSVMLKLRDATVRQSSMVYLLDWYNLDHEMILVMERPMPCEDLSIYLTKHKPPLKEKDAKIIVKQLVQAAIYLYSANIFHRDIKLDNILIRTDSEEPKVFLIDFGMSAFLERKPSLNPVFGSISANRKAEYITVKQLGGVLSELGKEQVLSTMDFEISKFSDSLSENCKDFLTKIVSSCDMDFPSLEDLLGHPWLS